MIVLYGESNELSIKVILIFATSSLLYPFSKLAYDEITNYLMGNNVILMSGLIFIIWKLFINVVLFAYSIFIAPFGILYLWYRGRKRMSI